MFEYFIQYNRRTGYIHVTRESQQICTVCAAPLQNVLQLNQETNLIQSNEYNGSRPRPLFPSLSKNLKYKNRESVNTKTLS